MSVDDPFSSLYSKDELPPFSKACLPVGRGGGEGLKVEENDEKNDFVDLGIHPDSSNPDVSRMPGRGGDRPGGEGQGRECL